MIALLCARHQGRYEWDGILDTETVMAAAAWDCLPWPHNGTLRLTAAARRPRHGRLPAAAGHAVIITGNVPAGEAPPCPPGTRLLAAIDVEWSKNYRVKDGNVPFCFSVAWLPLPGAGDAAVTDTTRFWYTSAYVEDDRERGDLITAAELRARDASPAMQAWSPGTSCAATSPSWPPQPAANRRRSRPRETHGGSGARPDPASRPSSTPATTPGTCWPASHAASSTSAPTCGST